MTPLPEAQPLLALWGAGAAILVLLVLSALFAGSETALTTASRGRLHGLADRGEPGAAGALALDRGQGAAGRGDAARQHPRQHPRRLARDPALHPACSATAASRSPSVVMTALVLVFSEVMPRTCAIASPEATALRVARPIGLLVALRIAGRSPRSGRSPGWRSGRSGCTSTRRAARCRRRSRSARRSRCTIPTGSAETEQRDRLLGALDLGERQVEEVMMHRRDIEMIDAEAPPDAILAQAINSPHTRIPIFRGEPENIVGVIHAKDLSRGRCTASCRSTARAGALEGFDIMDVAMPPYFVPESTPLDEQLREFLRRRTHFALVVDEYGALQGLVTLEDIIEEIVGDIADEHDVEVPAGIEPQPRRLGRGRGRRLDPRPEPRLRLGSARRGGQHHRRAGHPRGAGDPERGPGVQLPRLPLRGARARRQPAGPPAGAQALTARACAHLVNQLKSLRNGSGFSPIRSPADWPGRVSGCGCAAARRR